MSKSGLKTEGHHAILSILEVYRSEILQKLNKRDRFCLYSWFHFLTFLAQNLTYTINI